MGPWRAIAALWMLTENAIVERILRSPRFHHGVRKIHDKVQDIQYGRDPNEPLRQGEATEQPRSSTPKFLEYFIDEIRNQFRGTPTETEGPAAPPKKKR